MVRDICQVQRQNSVQRNKKIRGEGPPGFWIYKTCSLFLLPRTYVSVPRDVDGTEGRQTLSLAVKCPQRISAAPANGAAGAPGMPEDLGPCQLLEVEDEAMKLSDNAVGA